VNTLPSSWFVWQGLGDERGLELFFNGLLENFDSKHRLGIHFLELCIFLLQGLQTFGISFTHETVFFAPPMEGCYGYLLLSTERFLIQVATVGLPQQADDFFWFMSLLLHSESFCLFKTSHSLWASFSGGGQCRSE